MPDMSEDDEDTGMPDMSEGDDDGAPEKDGQSKDELQLTRLQLKYKSTQKDKFSFIYFSDIAVLKIST